MLFSTFVDGNVNVRKLDTYVKVSDIGKASMSGHCKHQKLHSNVLGSRCLVWNASLQLAS